MWCAVAGWPWRNVLIRCAPRRWRSRSTAATGAVRPIRWAVAHDCGLIINPNNLELTIEGNIVQGTSRALLEEVTYDRDAVTSVDWMSYPILDITQVPQQIDIVMINRPDLPATGAGEASTRPVAAAIANAIFDATGVPHAPRAVHAGTGEGRAGLSVARLFAAPPPAPP